MRDSTAFHKSATAAGSCMLLLAPGVAASRVSHYFFMGGEGIVSLTELFKQFGGAFSCIFNPVDVVINAGGNSLNGERGCQEDARIEG